MQLELARLVLLQGVQLHGSYPISFNACAAGGEERPHVAHEALGDGGRQIDGLTGHELLKKFIIAMHTSFDDGDYGGTNLVPNNYRRFLG